MAHQTDTLEFREVSRKKWADLERLFEGRGGPKHCWCMVWRASNDERSRPGGAVRKAALKRRVDAGIPVGILGYMEGEPVAWCSIAPRSTYRRLGRPEGQDIDPDSIWSIVCFYVPTKLRGQGITRHLIRAAVEHARDKGATVVEAYPVDPDSPSYRFMGFVSSFEAAGFHEVGRVGIRRHVTRMRLR